MTPADFDAELRRRLDALPCGLNGLVELGIGMLGQPYLDALYAALTAAPPGEAACPDCGRPNGQGHVPNCASLRAPPREEPPPPCICGHPMCGQCYPDGCLTSPKAMTPAYLWCSLCHQIHSATSSACPAPPAPEDGTRDTGWVIETTRAGLYGRFVGAAPGGSGWNWMDGLERARIYDTEIEALRFGCAAVGPNRVRRVRRQPGTRRFEIVRPFKTPESVGDSEEAAAYITRRGKEVGVGGYYRIRPLPATPGPWQLDPEGGGT